MIIPAYDGDEIYIPPGGRVNAFRFTALDAVAILQSFSFFCGDERAKDIKVHITSGQTKISPFRLLKGSRGDSSAQIYIKNQDTLAIELENEGTVQLPVYWQVTLRKYAL
ncbi:MAG: hypothetical protein ACTSWW_13475 [Promethearchaeota archaeon]